MDYFGRPPYMGMNNLQPQAQQPPQMRTNKIFVTSLCTDTRTKSLNTRL